jgi:hypothetical protein
MHESGFLWQDFERERVDRKLPSEDINLAVVAVIVGIINIILLLILLFIYVSSYRKLKSSFSMGLILFALLLIMQNSVFIFFLLVSRGFHGPGMGGSVLSINIIQFGALLVLLRLAIL